ncbi:hypothetical protein CBL_12647 [Carabus blaptoides fortunei]
MVSTWRYGRLATSYSSTHTGPSRPIIEPPHPARPASTHPCAAESGLLRIDDLLVANPHNLATLVERNEREVLISLMRRPPLKRNMGVAPVVWTISRTSYRQ